MIEKVDTILDYNVCTKYIGLDLTDIFGCDMKVECLLLENISCR